MSLVRPRATWNLNTLLLRLSQNSYFSINDATCGVQVWGAIGSGKSSATATALAMAYLLALMGGLVLIAKPEDVSIWLEYARKTRRSKSVIVFDETQGFNFMDYSLAKQGLAGIGNIVEALMRVIAAADIVTGNVGAPSESFWIDSIRQLLNYSLPLIYSAWGTVSVASIIDFVVSATAKPEQYSDERFAKTSFAARTLRQAARNPAVRLLESELQRLFAYWFEQYPGITERTRSNMVVSLCARLDRFLHGRLRDCFCGKTTIVPEATFHGAILLMNTPALTWLDDGLIAQVLVKHYFQKAVEARNALEACHRERPVFLFCDESQLFLQPSDQAFLAVARQSRACVVLLSQNIVGYAARFGKDKSDAAEALMNTCATVVFHANSCFKTNSYASQLIGRTVQMRANQSRSVGTSRSHGLNEGTNVNRGRSANSGSSVGAGGGGWNQGTGTNSGSGENYGANVGRGWNENATRGESETLDWLIEPRFFAESLLTGGEANKKIVTAVWFRAGANFPDGYKGSGNVLLTRFRQQ